MVFILILDFRFILYPRPQLLPCFDTSALVVELPFAEISVFLAHG